MIKIELKNTSQALIYKNVKNTYEKGSFYCIYIEDNVVKIPIQDIFRIEENYKFN